MIAKTKSVLKLQKKEYIFCKVRKSRYSSVEVLQFVGQKVRVLSGDFGKEEYIWCRTYGAIRSDVLFHKKDLIRTKKSKKKIIAIKIKI